MKRPNELVQALTSRRIVPSLFNRFSTRHARRVRAPRSLTSCISRQKQGAAFQRPAAKERAVLAWSGPTQNATGLNFVFCESTLPCVDRSRRDRTVRRWSSRPLNLLRNFVLPRVALRVASDTAPAANLRLAWAASLGFAMARRGGASDPASAAPRESPSGVRRLRWAWGASLGFASPA